MIGGNSSHEFYKYLYEIRDSKFQIDVETLLSTFSLGGGAGWWENYKGVGVGEKVDLLIGGCSFTYGRGVDYEKSWGPLLAEKLGVDTYVNISQVGWSLHAFATRMLNYMHINGNPKYVAFLVPELYRAELLMNARTFRSADNDKKLENSYDVKGITLAKRDPLTFNPVKYSKSPHIIEEILPFEMALQQSCTALGMLLKYCEQNKIKVAWGTWSSAEAEFFDYVSSVSNLFPISFDSYVDTLQYQGKGNPNNTVVDGCHLDLKALYPDNFDEGNDGKHAGVHAHAHWAEDFYNKLK